MTVISIDYSNYYYYFSRNVYTQRSYTANIPMRTELSEVRM